MVRDFALVSFTRHIARHGAVSFRFEEGVELRRTANRPVGYLHAWQQCDQSLQAIGCDGLAVRDHHDLLRAGDDAEQLDGRNMRGRIDDDGIGKRRRVGDGSERGADGSAADDRNHSHFTGW